MQVTIILILTEILIPVIQFKDQPTMDFEEESNILVAVRVRPMITREVNLGDFDIIRPEDQLIVIHLLYS